MLFNPAVVLALMMLLGYQFPGNPLLLENIGPNEYRPSTVGAYILIALCVVLSLALLRRRFGRWWAADAVIPWTLPALPANAAAAALWIWITSGLEGNILAFAFAFVPALGLATLRSSPEIGDSRGCEGPLRRPPRSPREPSGGCPQDCGRCRWNCRAS